MKKTLILRTCLSVILLTVFSMSVFADNNAAVVFNCDRISDSTVKNELSDEGVLNISALNESISEQATDWNYVSYPLKSQYPNGIETVDPVLAKESKIDRPINTGFEERNEINAVKMEDYNGQLNISEEKYNGKFALEVIKNDSTIIPVKESEYFKTSDSAINITKNSDSKTTITDGDMSAVIDGNLVTLEGTAKNCGQVSISVTKGGKIVYVNQYETEDGSYRFSFGISDYGTYSIKISDESGLIKQTAIKIPQAGKGLPSDIVPVEEIDTKCNFFNVMIKPMYMSEEVSFYTKLSVTNSNGNITEKYVLIKSDKNSDGIFKVGEDLNRGKWQKIELSLLDVDEDFENGVVSGLYVSANNGSHWLFDDITSGYKAINEKNANLPDFARNNVIYTKDGIKFTETGTSTAVFNNAATVLTGGVNVSETIVGVDIVSGAERANGSLQNISDSGKTLYSDLLISDKWTVNDTSSKIKYTNGTGIINFKPLGNAVYTLNNNETADRVTVNAQVAYANLVPAAGQAVQIDLYEGVSSSAYYSTKVNVSSVLGKQNIKTILPKLKANTKIKFTNLCETLNINLSDFKVCELIETDWNSDAFGTKSFSYRTFFDGNTVKESLTDETGYAVKNPNAKGIKNTGSTETSHNGYSYGTNSKMRFKLVNLNTTPAYVKINGSVKWLGYGECYVEGDNYTVTLPPNQNVILVSSVQVNDLSSDENLSSPKTLDGLYNEYIVAPDNEKIYYANHYDNSYMYCYDFTQDIKKRVAEKSVSEIYAINQAGTILVFKDSENKLCRLDLTTNTVEIMGDASDFNKAYINAKDEIYVIQGKYYVENRKDILSYELYGYKDKKLTSIMEMYKLTDEMKSVTEKYANISFDSTGEAMVVNHSSKVGVYKKINGIWQNIRSVQGAIAGSVYISDDLTTIYHSVNNSTNFDGKTAEGVIVQRNSDGTYITSKGYIYNSSTGELYKLTETVGESMNYSPENDILFYVSGGILHRIKLNSDKAEAKFAFSFDGKNNWYSYLNGRWLLVSENSTPTETEMYKSGMTVKQVNEISSADFGKIYKDGDSILTVDIAIFMNSASEYISPVIKSITVKTVDNNELDGIYSVNMETFKKDDYRSVNSIVPVENFTSGAECYYVLSLGNDWLYTYKNGKIAKLAESADELLSNMAENWILFKQYGMTAKELRNIPQKALNQLLVNENYANTEFGVIYAIKTKSDSTEQYKVSLKLQSESKYISKENIVVEIALNGNDVKVIDSKDFSREDIEDFVAWVEARQNGSGDVFYVLKNDKVQYFINYYMINSINVYSKEQ